MKNGMKCLKSMVRWAGIVGFVFFFCVLMYGLTAHANTTLEVTNVYVVKENLMDRFDREGGSFYTSGETIDLMIEFNQAVTCTSGSIEMRALGGSQTLTFNYDRSSDDNRTAVFIFTVNEDTDNGRLYFDSRASHTLRIPCSVNDQSYQLTGDEIDVHLNIPFLNYSGGITTTGHKDEIIIDTYAPIFEELRVNPGVYGLEPIDIEVRFWDGNPNIYREEVTIFSEDSYLMLSGDRKAVFNRFHPLGNTFRYIVQPGEVIERLEIEGFYGTVTDLAGNLPSSTYNVAEHGLVARDIYISVDGILPEVAVSCADCEQYNPSVIIMATDVGTGVTELLYEWSESPNTPFEFSGNSESLAAINGSATGEALPPSDNANGTYYLHVQAKDGAGNRRNQRFGPYDFDNAPPAVSVSPSEGAVRGGISVNITASDEGGSGVKEIRYQWNDGDLWQKYAGNQMETTMPATEGSQILEVYAVDLAGNESEVQTFTFIVDNTAPKPNFDYSDNYQPKQSHPVTIEIDGDRDGERGSLYYLWSKSAVEPDNGDWTQIIHDELLPATTVVSTLEHENGNWYLHVKTVDEIGNFKVYTLGEGVEGGVTFLLDNTPPTIAFQPDGNNGIAQSETIVLIVEDNESEFEKLSIRYLLLREGETPQSYGQDEWRTPVDGEVEITGMSGNIRVHVEVTDEAGNIANATSEPFAVDHLPPHGSITFSNGHGHTNKTNIEVEFEAEDNLTSIELRYAFGEGEWSEWLSYATVKSEVIQFGNMIDGEGIYQIHVQYQDEAENHSEIYTIDMTYDTTPPTVTEVTYTPMHYTNQPVTVTVSFDDIFSPGTESFQIEENGMHTLTIYDKAGNATTVDVHISNIDITLPTIHFLTNGTTRNRQAVSSIVAATDNVSSPENIEMFYAWSLSNDSQDRPQEWTEMISGDEVQLDSVDGEWFLWVRAIDEAGNERTSISNAFLLDNTAPEVLEVTYSPEYRTAMPVTAELRFSEPVYLIEPHQTEYLVTRDEVTFDDNGTVNYVFVDEAGNQSSFTVVVDWIDHSLPTATVTMSAHTWTNQPVDVIISTEGDPPRALHQIKAPHDAELLYIKTIEGDTLHQPTANVTVTEAVYRFHSNGTIRFVIEDLETGMKNDGQAQVSIIDLVPPTGEIRFSPESWTQGNVTATLTVSDDSGVAPVILSENGAEVEFTTNGEHIFQFRDAAGNVAEMTAKVDWIVRETPEPTITFNTDTWTNEPVTATISFADETAPITMTNHDSRTYTFNNNGTFTFHFEDAAGNVGNSGPITVHWIDREKPTGVLEFSERGWTNQDVTVTLHASDNSKEPVIFLNEGGNQHTFTENGAFTFVFRDAAGNMNSVEAVVDRIDKTPLEASIRYSTTEPTNGMVRATLRPNKPGVQVLNNNGSMIYDFEHNGSFTFDMIDRAGNTNSITAEVNHIVRDTPAVEVVYSTTEPTNSNVIASVRSIDPDQEIYVLNNFRRKEYVFTENGTFTFIVRDLAGNTVKVDAVVANIDKSKAEITLEYSECLNEHLSHHLLIDTTDH